MWDYETGVCFSTLDFDLNYSVTAPTHWAHITPLTNAVIAVILQKKRPGDPGQRLLQGPVKARGLRKAYCEVRVAVDSLAVIVFHGKAAVGNGGCIDSKQGHQTATTPPST